MELFCGADGASCRVAAWAALCFFLDGVAGSLRCTWQPEPEAGSAFRLGFRSDCTAPSFDCYLAKVKSQAGFAGFVFSFREKREHLIGGLIFGQAGALVIHKCEDLFAFFFQADCNGGIRRAVAKSIFEEISEHAIEP